MSPFSDWFQVPLVFFQSFGNLFKLLEIFPSTQLVLASSLYFTVFFVFVFVFWRGLVFWQGTSIYLSFHFLFSGVWKRQNPLHDKFFSYWLTLGLVVWPRLGDPLVSQNPREFYASHFLLRILFCTYTFSKYGQILFFLQNSLLITFHTQSSLLKYSFWASLLHSRIMWLNFSSLSPHNWLFCCVTHRSISPEPDI